jgi:hypothetical protein
MKWDSNNGGVSSLQVAAHRKPGCVSAPRIGLVPTVVKTRVGDFGIMFIRVGGAEATISGFICGKWGALDSKRAVGRPTVELYNLCMKAGSYVDNIPGKTRLSGQSLGDCDLHSSVLYKCIKVF